jgi:hypothetical protein
MLRHGDRLALALDLKRVLESFPVARFKADEF